MLDQTCVGCSLCTIACPFGTVFLKPAEHKATKCDLCGGDPACAMACPTDCITYSDVPDSADESAAWMGLLANQVSKAYHEAFGN